MIFLFTPEENMNIKQLPIINSMKKGGLKSALLKTFLMKTTILYLLISFSVCAGTKAQLSLSLPFANNGKGNVKGTGLRLAYEFHLKKRWSTTTQIGFKSLKAYNDFTENDLKNIIFEAQQTVSYAVVNNKKYVFSPHIGINLRYFKWSAKMRPPYNAIPIRQLAMEFRDDWLIISSVDGLFSDSYEVANLGFSLQLENQFAISNRITLLLIPFIEDDYDGIQTVSGGYIGVKYKLRK